MPADQVVCILLADFPLELYFKTHPSARRHPVVLADSVADTAVVSACNDRAAGFDVTPGMTVARANSLCPGLVAGIRDSEREETVLHKITEVLGSVGPQSERQDNAVFLETARLHRLYGDESGIARKILTVLKPFDYPVKIGFAANKFVARLASDHAPAGQYVIVPNGSESAWLRHVRVDRLAPAENTADTLYDLGLATVGQVAALPANEIVRRFGSQGTRIARRARGGDPDLFIPTSPTEDHRGRLTLDYPVRSTGAIVAGTKRILARLLAHLNKTGRACEHLHVTLALEDRTEHVFQAAVEKPAVSTEPFLRQVRLHLDRLHLPAAVADITVRIPHTAVLVLEQTAFDRGGPDDRIDPRTCDTIDRTLDGNRLCTVGLSPAHLPERTFRLSPVAPSTAKRKPAAADSLDRNQPYSLNGIGGLRLLQPPRPAEIRGGRKQHDHEIVCFLKADRLAQAITRRRGPWKISGDWWNTGFDRVYYEMQTGDHRRYLVFYDRSTSRWFLQGIYD